MDRITVKKKFRNIGEPLRKHRNVGLPRKGGNIYKEFFKFYLKKMGRRK